MHLKFTGSTEKLSPANSELLKLLEKCNLMSLAPKFQKHDVTVDIIWDLDDDMLSELNLTKIEKLKYTTARKKFGKQGNYFI